MSSSRNPNAMEDFLPPYRHDEATAQRKAAAQKRYEEFQSHRQQQLLEQACADNSAEVRIRIWEELHGLHLPADESHRLLALIAAQTHLALTEVQQEQRRRAGVR